ncbi:hypothetical protein SAY87_022366 [Trapa incisa]|uniref:non-specific serine/threonine protein kinase n=1 Tax=Trapa incisa TaxID=236973 RepID=A0AAN7KA41_9MYRT|nr:hypothetical protein SAY87_022366 [Trapa incisa]
MENPPVEELLKKIQELEAGQAQLKQEMSRLQLSNPRPYQHARQRSHSTSPVRRRLEASTRRRGAGAGLDTRSALRKGSSFFPHSSPLQRESHSLDPPDEVAGAISSTAAISFTDKQYLNILQSMGHSVHMIDVSGRIVYWNRTAENLYGYSAAEALGKNAIELIIDPQDFDMANKIVESVKIGEHWTGQIPVKNKMGENFLAVATNSPFYDDDNSLVGIICVSSDSRPFQDMKPETPTLRQTATTKLGLNSEQPIQTAIASKISDLASKVSKKVRSKIWMEENNTDHETETSDVLHSDHGLSDDHRDDAASSGASTPRGDIPPSSFSAYSQSDERSPGKPVNSGDESNKPALHKILTSKAEAWIGKKGLTWTWRGNDREGSEGRISRSDLHLLHHSQEIECMQLRNSSISMSEGHTGEGNLLGNNEATGSWSSFNINSTSSASSCGSTSSSAVNKVDIETDCLDYVILWEDLIIGEQIGQGSCGTVYHALWYGSDVAVKVFSKQEYSDDVILSFKQEVSLMKKLRHPNILLFMGAVTSPERLCIVTEFLPRGSLFRLLQRHMAKLDWRRRIHMGLDIARGMNYLHHYNPPIIHRDLKSSNLLVDKNWNVKVADFGLSRLKHETFLTTKTGKGTPQWMAPEVLRNEPSDEKSDIYSFGVIMWELTTEKIPWDNLNSMQVIGAVGFMNQRLDIPKDADPQWASIMESCWDNDPQCRPSFQELLEKLKDLKRQYALRFQASRSSAVDAAQRD